MKGSREYGDNIEWYLCIDCLHLNKYVWVYADVRVLNIDDEEEDEYEVEHLLLQDEHYCQPRGIEVPNVHG